MASLREYPRYEINVKDGSPAVVTTDIPNPLHVPLFIIHAERGEVGVLTDCNTQEAKKRYGDSTFEYNSKFFQHPTVFARTALGYGRVMLMRVASPDAKSGGSVIEAHIIKDAPIVQYERDAEGFIKYEADGVTKIPLKEADNITILTEPGVKIKWMLRELTTNETIDTIVQKTTVDGEGNEVTILPIIAGASPETSPGAYINYTGYRLYFDRNDDIGAMTSTGSLFFRFAPIEKNPVDGTVSRITNRYSDPSVYFSFDPEAYDAATDRSMWFDNILAAQYNDEAMSFSMHVYSENVKSIGQMIVDLDKENDYTLSNPFMANILSGVNADGRPYEHVELDETGILLSKDVIQFFSGGSDGQLGKESLETLTRQYLDLDNYPEIVDSARYPFTHIYDSGYDLKTKKFLIDLTNVRGDIMVDLSTQDIAMAANDKAEDYSIGSSLRNYALLYPESEIFATPAFRARIYQQCGYLAGTTYQKLVPLTYDRMLKRLQSQAGTSITSIIDTLDNGSAITAFKSLSWVPSAPDHKQESWSIGLNYVQNYDKGAKWHYAGDRTIYPINTSILTDSFIADVIVYLKHIVRYQWSRLTASHAARNVRLTMIKERVEKAAGDAFGSFVRISCTPYLEETVNGVVDGSVTVVDIAVYGNMPDRVWNVRIPVYKEEA